jgi:hypothetical protein
MWWATFLSSVVVATTAAWTAVQLGWRPPFVAMWDGLSPLIFGLTMLLLGVHAALGLANLVPAGKLPGPIRAVPVNVALFVPCWLSYCLLAVSSASKVDEVVNRLMLGTAIGVAMGVGVGLLDSLGKRGDQIAPAAEASPFTRKQTAAWLLGILVVGTMVLAFPRKRDDGKLIEATDFGSDVSHLKVGVFVAPLGERFALIKVVDHARINALILEKDELDSVVGLWREARRQQSPAWRAIGEASDSEPSDPTTLVLTAGSSIHFTARSPHGGAVNFDLPPSDYRRFDDALAQVSRSLDQ